MVRVGTVAVAVAVLPASSVLHNHLALKTARAASFGARHCCEVGSLRASLEAPVRSSG